MSRRLLLGATAPVVAPIVLGGCSNGSDGPAEWDLVRSDGSNLTLAVVVGSSSCGSVGDVDVEEASDTVQIDVRVEVENGDCTSDFVTKPAQVDLERPLAGRKLTGCRPDHPVVRRAIEDEDAHDCAQLTK